MPIEDKRRRLSGEGHTTTQLSVAELIARREAETQPIPVITDEGPAEPTVRFAPVKKKTQPARELHITELLRREGRADDTDAGGFAMGKLVAAASGGVVLCGSVAFGASQWLSGPDERPLAEVRFDERAQARGATGNGVVKLPAPQTETPGTETAEATEEAKTRVAPYTQQQQRPQTQTQTPQQQTAEQTVTPPAESTTTPPSSSTETTTPPSSTSTPAPPPSESSTPPSETTSPSPSTGVSIGVDLGILDPVLGNFDFFAPAN